METVEGGIFAVLGTEGEASVLFDTWLWLWNEGREDQGPLPCARATVM